MPAVLVFVDGVGIGERDASRNPLARRETLLSQFVDGGAALPRGGVRVAVDAALGVPGRPQSATGQTALLTGENAPALLGRHLLGFPNERLRDLLRRRSIFRRLADVGARAAILNGYPANYLDAVGLPHAPPCPGGAAAPLAETEGLPARARKLRSAAAPYAWAAAGGSIATFDAVRAGRALAHDLTGSQARARGFEIPLRTPQAAAELVAALARKLDFAMLDYFRTDDAGHAQSFEAADRALADLDPFLRLLIDLLPQGRDGGHSLFVVSDHGNMEDLRHRNHTLARVPLLAFGPAARYPLPDRLDALLEPMLAAALERP